MFIIIPARYDSSRLPGKPLVDVAGKPLIQRVYDCAVKADIGDVIVATDDERIRKVVKGFGGKACMTTSDHQSGTDRIAEVISKLDIDDQEIVINLQGDEPLMPPELIQQVGDTLKQKTDAVVATACYPVHDKATLNNPNVVKVVCDHAGYAMYFSRAPIPWPRDRMAKDRAGDGADDDISACKHIGIYGYRAGFVSRYAAWSPCPPEQAEQLEQLRVLWHGERIAVCEAKSLPGTGVDTPEDLEIVRQHFTTY